MSDHKIVIIDDPDFEKLCLVILESYKPRVEAIAQELSKAKWADELLVINKVA
jgi:hypothetical protein